MKRFVAIMGKQMEYTLSQLPNRQENHRFQGSGRICTSGSNMIFQDLPIGLKFMQKYAKVVSDRLRKIYCRRGWWVVVSRIYLHKGN